MSSDDELFEIELLRELITATDDEIAKLKEENPKVLQHLVLLPGTKGESDTLESRLRDVADAIGNVPIGKKTIQEWSTTICEWLEFKRGAQ